MNYGLYLSASGMLTQMHRQDVAAHNLANVATDGFKRDLAIFRQRAPESMEDPSGFEDAHALLDRLGGGVLVDRSRFDSAGGPLKRTDRPLDLAIHGEGYFVVRAQGPDGPAERFTRDGRFLLDADNRLVTATGGYPVLAQGGQTITVDPAAGPLTIDAQGRIRQSNAVVSQLRFVAPGAETLKHLGAGLLEGDAASAAPASGRIEQGFLEQSNVNPISELLELMNATKAISANGNLIRYHDLLMDRAANVLGRVA